MCDDDWYKPDPDRPAPALRQPKPGEEVWRPREVLRAGLQCGDRRLFADRAGDDDKRNVLARSGQEL